MKIVLTVIEILIILTILALGALINSSVMDSKQVFIEECNRIYGADNWSYYSAIDSSYPVYVTVDNAYTCFKNGTVP